VSHRIRIVWSRPLADEALKAQWDESKHPRDEAGRFASKIQAALDQRFRDGSGADVAAGDLRSVQQTCRHIFGRPLRARELAGLVGAGQGDSVQVNARGSVLEFDVGREGVWTASREIRRDADGRVIEQVLMYIDEDKQDQGLGTEIFASQVVNAQRLGLDRIECTAMREAAFRGDYAWPRMGYDVKPGEPSPVGKACRQGKSAAQVALRRIGFSPESSLRAIMASEQGRAWWREYGVTFKAVFNLRRSSYSMRTLARYVEERAKRQ
jgi:hypothetical protein